MKEGEKLDGLAFAQRPIKNEENEGRREGGMREGGGRIHFKEKWLVFRNRFFQRLLHTFLLSFFERVHVYTRFPARGVFIFYVGSHVTFGKIPSSMDRDHET